MKKSIRVHLDDINDLTSAVFDKETYNTYDDWLFDNIGPN